MVFFSEKSGQVACSRINTLLNLQQCCGKDDLENTIVFPFFPLLADGAYTFFDFTRDTLDYFHWLKEQPTERAIFFQEPESTGCYDVLANVSVICRTIAVRNELAGGFLVHGVMLAHQQGAVILAGASGGGKTTAARRMPDESWQKCSDDLTLVVKDTQGNYFAHPWPGVKAYHQYELCYDTERGIPLQGLFFLVQDAEVQIKPTKPIKAIAMLQRVAEQALELPDPSIDPEGVGELRALRLKNVSDFVRKVPTYELFLNMADPFWQDIEALLFNDEKKA